ncbi:MAG: aminoacyl-histidine dipeptidase [Lachnospiraceae bacterium]|nr:aminoacyl-histidine dipeptidase [Lachnospiraceae bacterium]
MGILENLEPGRVFYYFEEICNIPHGSGHMEPICHYLIEFAEKQGLSFLRDDSHNVVIRKAASAGYESAPGVILQGHCDMVCEKAPNSSHDFEKDSLKLRRKDDDLYAEDTTLGGDDGIAVAYMLAVLEDQTLQHPELECVFTSDEEIGLLGANALDTSVLKGKQLINLDSEEEGILWISCAGGMNVQCELPVNRVSQEGLRIEVSIEGLAGGHSGTEIDKGRANASILLGRFFFELGQELPYGIIDAAGGTKDNAITRIARAGVLIQEECKEEFLAFALRLQQQLRKEYTGTDEGITIRVEPKAVGNYDILNAVSREKTVLFLMQLPYGVQKMSGVINGLVETSCNLGIFELSLTDDYLFACISIRSSVGTAKYALGDKIRYLTEFLGGEFDIAGDYPAWEYREDSPLRETMKRVYEELYHTSPKIEAIHAGLECGLFYDKIPGLDCISIGPDMKDIHTSREKLSISSTERVYQYLIQVLQELK